jgi:type I restriction enzyme S subunit
MEPSGVEGLGKVPKHWDVRRGKFVFESIDVRSEQGEEELLTVSSRDGVVPRSDLQVTMFKADSYAGHKLCWPHDLVINSLWAWANGLGFSKQHGIVSTAYGIYRLRDPYRPLWQFLDLALRSGAYAWQFQVRSRGIWKSRLQLTDWAFLDMPIALPPDHEASMICKQVASATAELDKAMLTATQEIALLKEYRASLIADVVTGKVDVREAAARLPDDDYEEEQVPFDDIGEPGDLDDATAAEGKLIDDEVVA